MEQIFPFLGIRFISLNDGYDSEKENRKEVGLQSAFQNLLYDWYSKDLSIKVKTSLKTKKEKGFYFSSCPPYGYQRERTNPYGVKICKEEAEVVCFIFSLTLQGKTLCEIARLFNQTGIQTRSKGALWRASMISQILKNPFYTGDMVYEKYERMKVGGKSYPKEREKWRQISNHHEAVIEREIFEEVQRLYRKKREKKKEKNIEKSRKKFYPFIGKLICTACQKKLQRRHTKIPYFTCVTRYITDTKICVKRLEVDTIIQIVRQFIWQMILSCQIQNEIKDIQSGYCKQKTEQLQEKIQRVETELIKLSQKRVAAYRKYQIGSIEKECYLEWKSQIQEKEKEWMVLQKYYNEKLAFLREMGQKEEEFFLIHQDLVEIFIRKILVSERKKLVIHWTFSFHF